VSDSTTRIVLSIGTSTSPWSCSSSSTPTRSTERVSPDRGSSTSTVIRAKREPTTFPTCLPAIVTGSPSRPPPTSGNWTITVRTSEKKPDDPTSISSPNPRASSDTRTTRPATTSFRFAIG